MGRYLKLIRQLEFSSVKSLLGRANPSNVTIIFTARSENVVPIPDDIGMTCFSYLPEKPVK